MPTAKRGRPKASEIPILIREADEEGGTMRCPYLGCRRKFPRNKSLKAHLRTHTGKVCFIIYF